MVAGTHPPHPLKTKMDGGAGVAPLLRPDNQPLFGDTAIMEMDAHHLSSPHLNSAQHCTMGKHVSLFLFNKDSLCIKVIQNVIKGCLDPSEPKTPENKQRDDIPWLFGTSVFALVQCCHCPSPTTSLMQHL